MREAQSPETRGVSLKTQQVGRLLIAHDQNFYHLACIQTVSLGLPAVTVGYQLASQYGPGVAICSVFAGNLILWLIAMTIISMAIEGRVNAIENVKSYLGKSGALFMALVLIVAFISWYVLQINASIPPIGKYFSVERKETMVRLGAGLGFVTALLSVGGIRFIKWITVVSLPGVFCYYLYAMLRSEFSFASIDTWGLSLTAIISTVLVLLPGVVNLPTFFRHAQSRADCYLALMIMTFLISFFEISTIWMQFEGTSPILSLEPNDSLFSIASIAFIILTLICTNLLNIYFGSACWESFVPRFEGAKGYAIIGLIGTAAYTFIQIYSPVRFLEDLANCYIASLGTVLLIAFLMRSVAKHRPRTWDLKTNGFCWFIGALMATISSVLNIHDDIGPLLIGVGASALVYLVVIFVEETVWSAKKLFSQ